MFDIPGSGFFNSVSALGVLLFAVSTCHGEEGWGQKRE